MVAIDALQQPQRGTLGRFRALLWNARSHANRRGHRCFLCWSERMPTSGVPRRGFPSDADRTDLPCLLSPGRHADAPPLAQDGVSSSFTSHTSTEARTPGVSEASIARGPVHRPACPRESRSTAGPRPFPDSRQEHLESRNGDAGRGPPDSLIRERAPSMRSALTSVNLTTRTYMATTFSFAVPRP